MASSSVLRIEVVPDDEDEDAVFTSGHSPSSTPPPRRQRAYTDSDLLSADLEVSHTPPPTGGPHVRGRGASSGYMSSSSNLQSPRIVVSQPHPSHRPLPSYPSYDHEDLLSEYSTARQHSKSGYYHQREYEATLPDGIYSRLEHSNASTLTRNTPTLHQFPPTGGSLQTDHGPRYVHQQSMDLDSHLRPHHSHQQSLDMDMINPSGHVHMTHRAHHGHQRSLDLENSRSSDHMIHRSHHGHQRSLDMDNQGHMTHRSYHSHQRSRTTSDHMTHRPRHSHQRSLDMESPGHMTHRSHHNHQRSLPTENFTPHLTPNTSYKRRLSPPRTPLALVLRSLDGLDGKVKRWLVKADQHLKWQEFDKAIPFLEGAVVRTRVYPTLQLILWELLGNAQMAVGKSKKASVCHLHHLAHSRAQGDYRGVARAECNLGISYMRLGLFKLAGRCFLQYLKNSRSIQDECGVECACSNLGLLSKTLALKNYQAAMERGEGEAAMTSLTACLRRAIIFFKQHLEVVLTYGEIEKQGRAYGNIGSCYELLRDYPEAIFYHKKRLEVARAIGDMHSELCTLCNLGNCFRAKGDLGQALEHYQMNLEMAQTLGDEQMEELIQHNLGVTYELLNQLDKAIVCYTLYLGMVVQREDVKKQAEGFSALARLYLETGQTTKAHEYTLNLVDVFKKLGDHTSLISAQHQLKSIVRLMKQEKRKRRGSHTLSKQGRFRAHTVSRASNLFQEFAGHASSGHASSRSSSRARPLQDKMGTWSTGRRPRPLLNYVPSEDLGPDPILVMADVVPSWDGHLGAGLDVASSYAAPPLPSTAHHWSYDRSHDRSHDLSHDSYRQNVQSRSLGSLSSCSSGSYDHLTPPQTPRDPAHSHTHPLHYSQCHTHPSEALYSHRHTNKDRDDYELVDPPSDSSTGRSTALPPLSYTSSLTPSPEEGRGSSQKEEEEDYMRELQRAGLELARAGLQLAGYEGEGVRELEVEEGTDKEWEQWQQINEEEQGSVFGSLMSVAGTRERGGRGRKKPTKQLFKHRLHATTSAPNL